MNSATLNGITWFFSECHGCYGTGYRMNGHRSLCRKCSGTGYFRTTTPVIEPTRNGLKTSCVKADS